MMAGLAVALLLSAAAEPVRLSGPSLEGADLPPADLGYYTAYFANGLRQQGIAPEATEGADGSASGELKRVGATGMQISLRVARPTGETIAAFTMTAQTDAEIPDLLTRASQELAGELFRRLERQPVPQKAQALPPAPASTSAVKLHGGVVGGLGFAAVGAAVLVGGLVLYLMAKDKLGAVARGAPASYFAAQQQASEARTFSTVSVALLGVGGLLCAGGVLYALYSAKVNTFIALSPFAFPGEGGLVFSGAFP